MSKGTKRHRLALLPVAITLILSFASLFWLQSTNEVVSKSTDLVLVLLAILIGLSVDVVLRLVDRDGFERNERGLLDELHAHPEIIPQLSSIAVSMSTIRDEDLPESFLEHAAILLRDCSTELAEIAEGRLHTVQGDSALMLSFLRLESGEVLGVTECSDASWWNSAMGYQFRQANAEVVQRSGKVFRVFILDSSSADLQVMKDEMEHQSALGITCFWIWAEDVPSVLYLNSTVIGQSLGHEDIVNGRAETVQYCYSVSSPDILRTRSRIERLIAKSTVYTTREQSQV